MNKLSQVKLEIAIPTIANRLETISNHVKNKVN